MRNVVIIVDCWNAAGAEVVEVASFISILIVTGCFGLYTRGGTPPFRPLPFGMFEVNRRVTFGSSWQIEIPEDVQPQ